MRNCERGFVYIVSNSAMPGLLKVGHTRQSLSKRLSQLRSTGVPSRFVVELAFDVDRPKVGEKLLHVAFRKNRFDKEFFKLPLQRAVETAKTVIENSSLVVYRVDGRAKEQFFTKKELREISRKRKSQEKKNKANELVRSELQTVAREETEVFLVLAPKVQRILLSKTWTSRVLFGLFTNHFDTGRSAAKGLSDEEKRFFYELHECIDRLRHAGGFQGLGIPQNCESLIAYDGWKSRPSDLLNGVFRGLGLRPFY